MGSGVVAAFVLLITPQPPAVDPISRLNAWIAAVERHKPGTADAPARETGAWGQVGLRDFAADLAVFLDALDGARALSPRDRPRPRPSRPRPRSVINAIRGLASDKAKRYDWTQLLKGAALLHADIAMLVPLERTPVQPSAVQADPLQRRRASSGGTVVVHSEDGVALDVEHGTLHWDVGRTVLYSTSSDPARDEWVRAWYRATTAYLLREEQFAYAVPHLNAALRLLADDERLLFYAGTLHETFAAAAVQAASRALEVRGDLKGDVGSVEAELELAQKFYRRALAANPDFPEARLHLGRVLGLLERHQDAAAELQRSIPQFGDTQLLYYGELFLGREEAASRRREAATAHLHRAAALFPRAQSPYLALSLLARTYGDRPGAVHGIKEVFALPLDEEARKDPWWDYHRSHVRNTDALLAELRRSFLTGEKP
jgi:Flp pilus assembly protein TadD